MYQPDNIKLFASWWRGFKMKIFTPPPICHHKFTNLPPQITTVVANISIMNDTVKQWCGFVVDNPILPNKGYIDQSLRPLYIVQSPDLCDCVVICQNTKLANLHFCPCLRFIIMQCNALLAIVLVQSTFWAIY